MRPMSVGPLYIVDDPTGGVGAAGSNVKKLVSSFRGWVEYKNLAT